MKNSKPQTPNTKPSFYDIIADSYDELHGEEQLRKARLVLANLKVNESDKLLDVGCGTGSYLSIFKCDKTGIDPSAKLLEKAFFPVFLGVAESLPFGGKSFDIVLCLTAIHHCADVKKALKEMLRVSRRDIVVSVLKKSSEFRVICDSVRSILPVVREVDDLHDVIFFARL